MFSLLKRFVVAVEQIAAAQSTIARVIADEAKIGGAFGSIDRLVKAVERQS